SQKIHNISNIK
ncbi:unnamed protein product, partial [Allacma fusca]